MADMRKEFENWIFWNGNEISAREQYIAWAAWRSAWSRSIAIDEDDSSHTINELSKLLARTAAILKGPEPPLTRWSYHDIPDMVQALKDAAEMPNSRDAVMASLREAANKGIRLSETCGPDHKFDHVFKFRSMDDLYAYEDALRAVLTVAIQTDKEKGNEPE